MSSFYGVWLNELLLFATVGPATRMITGLPRLANLRRRLLGEEAADYKKEGIRHTVPLALFLTIVQSCARS